MSLYMSKTNLIVGGSIVQDGEIVDLDDREASELYAEDKVTPAQDNGDNGLDEEAVASEAEDDADQEQPADDAAEPEKDLHDHTVDELQEIAKSQGIEGYTHMRKQEIIDAIKG